MIRQIALCLVVLLALAAPAAAWDPYLDDWSWEEEPVVWDPVVPQGIYYVTEVYVADVVTVSGPVTTYSTATIADTPGTYARVADTVSTGAFSAFDGAAFNGRASLGDGRLVGGTYYENFVVANGSFVPVSVVFFQDDTNVDLTPASTPAPNRPTPAPLVSAPPLPRTTPAPTPSRGPVVVRIDPSEVPSASPPPPPSPRRIPVLRPGIATSPLGDIAFSLEVLRGRSVALWFSAVADGVTVPVTSWRVVSGEHTALGSASGGREDPFRARWDVVTRPGATWILRVEATVVVDGIVHQTSGDVAVVVRSPALIR